MSDILVEPILATRADPEQRNGLITLRVQVPQYIWLEIMTHRMFARNASSSRAQSPRRHMAMGYYIPEVFYEDRAGMRVGYPVNPDINVQAARIYEDAWRKMEEAVQALSELGISREQANRLLPTIKIMTGIITGTERAWQHFLSLRLSENADVAMQRFARKVDDLLKTVEWNYSTVHIPYDDGSHDPRIAAAKIARVSYLGKAVTDDMALAERLLTDGHLSPFEHIVWFGDTDSYGEFLPVCVFNSSSEDWGRGADFRMWHTYRSFVEDSKDWHETIKRMEERRNGRLADICR